MRGHPLSLQLAASAVRERPDAPEDAVLPTVAQELAELWLAGLDPQTREALDATSVLRRITFSLLGAMLPAESPQAAFERLRALPFVELGREGLVIHDTVREAVAALVRASDPVRWRAYRTAAWRQIRRELAGSTGAARWASTADMIHLTEEPLVREAFFPSSVQHYAVETARPDDWADIEAIVARHEPAAEVELMRAWWAEVPQAFRVARHPRGIVVAFTVLAELTDVPQRLLTHDPVCEPWRRHLRSDPVPRGQCVLLARTALARVTGAAASPCFAALLRDMERASLDAGPALRRIYSVVHRNEALAAIAPLGFEVLAGARGIHHARRLVPPDRLRPRPAVDRGLDVRDRRARPAGRGRRARRRRARTRARRPPPRAHEARVRPARLPPGPHRPGRSRARRCCATSGATTGAAAPTWSRWPSPACGASWASAPRRCRPCAASATACRRSDHAAGVGLL